MRTIVRSTFPSWVEQFEGRTLYPYCDILGLVTIGIGNLIDPIQTCLRLPWVNVDGSKPSAAQVLQGWNSVKAKYVSLPEAFRTKIGGAYYERFSSIRLTSDAVDELVLSKLDANDAILCGRFAGFEDYPASAQLGIHSMAWAMGANFKFPDFKAACDANDWAEASAQCRISNGDRKRNAADAQLFLDALTLDPDQLAP